MKELLPNLELRQNLSLGLEIIPPSFVVLQIQEVDVLHLHPETACLMTAIKAENGQRFKAAGSS